MRYTTVLLTFMMGCLIASSAVAQDGSKMKFGKISKEEFDVKKFEKDTGAHAVILSEIGSSAFESDGKDLRLVFKVHRRIKIIDKNGYDLATVKVPLYKSDRQEERILNLKAVSYNLENGEIVDTRMDSKNVFTDKQDKFLIVKKFALPAVKEGTIIEYTYTISSPYYRHLRAWNFQGEYPALWSEYSVGIPEYFDYILIPQGYEPFVVRTKEPSRTTLSFRNESQGGAGPSNTVTVTPNVTIYKWAMKDVPPIRNESFITTIDNYVNRIEFQLSAYNMPEEPRKPVQSTWEQLMTDLMKAEDLGGTLNNNNGFLGDVVDGLIKDAKTDKEKAQKIYAWVRDNYTCTDHSALWMQKTLKTTFNAKNGNVAEINLLLVAMLKRAKLESYPIILSTRDNGYVYQFYPLTTRFNYLIAGAYVGDEFVNLDASEPLLGFGKLPAACYNGAARTVNEAATPVILGADSLREQKFTSVTLGKLENGYLTGSFQQRPTYFESYSVRKKVKDKSEDEFFKEITKSYTSEITLENKAIDDIKELESPVLVKYDFKMQVGNDDVLYISPLFGEAYRNNPFKSMERKFPVEMSHVSDEVYSFNMDVPEGYVVDELPKGAMARFNENDGLFQYLIQQQENHIQLRCRVKLAKANFEPDEYSSLREFFDLIVKKQAEQIVLKKKK
ncbi:transglutaminase superfamily protein [Chitinophaga niastensis]|uniref:Transglutaminase superfamily protein n=2 Tax=Chitinophaga niastensis TaxID=536980 RepID=A0A2P8HIZ8_CHINA|nr:transglutaminase superfamily protein [Chitinophaga niastensis]